MTLVRDDRPRRNAEDAKIHAENAEGKIENAKGSKVPKQNGYITSPLRALGVLGVES